MAFIKVPYQDVDGYLIFQASQIANMDVRHCDDESAIELTIRLCGESQRVVYRGKLALLVQSTIISAICSPDVKIVELDKSHHADDFCIFMRESDGINSGKGE